MKYSVHLGGNGSTGFARDHVVVNSFKAAVAALEDFAVGTGATNDSEGPGAYANVSEYHENDTVDQSWNEPFRQYVTGPRGGIRLEFR